MMDEVKECWCNVYVVQGKNILGFCWTVKDRAENMFFPKGHANRPKYRWHVKVK